MHDSVRALSPGYFALVMASGVISDGLRLEGVGWLSALFLAIAIGGFLALLVLTGWRVARFRTDLWRDLNDPEQAFGFFTFVAAVDVVAASLADRGLVSVAIGLLVVGTLGWVVLGYVVPWLTIYAHGKRSAVRTANGSWFVWVVASQSVAVVAAIVEASTDGHSGLALLAVITWAVGVFLYAAEGVFIALREMMYEFTPSDFSPSYWVAMGAAAITVLAGSRLLEMHDAATVPAMHSLIAGLSVMFWAFATWLIPVLTAAFLWRHVANKVPLRYTPDLWTLIFPLGMYGVASIDLGLADNLPLVRLIGHVELWVGVVAFTATFVAMALHLTRRFAPTAQWSQP